MSASIPLLRLRILSFSVALAGCAALAVAYSDVFRVQVVAAISACLFCLALWRVGGHVVLPLLPPEQPASWLPAERMEARLEHAPVALFLLRGEETVPLNAQSRRLLAPGYLCDVTALLQRLGSVSYRQMVDFDTEQGNERALVSVSKLVVEGRPERLLALLPLESELEAESLRAWQQLVRVLTHEIMNSLTPVASLSRMASAWVEESETELPEGLRRDLDVAFAAIASRTDGLVEFITSYRSLSSVPKAVYGRVVIADLFERLRALTVQDWQGRGGEAEFRVQSPTLELIADEGQLEQALLNLLRNAFEATAGQQGAKLEVQALLARGGRLRLDVSDNGPGVPESCVEHIFTPFYSTKAKGRGIGLALARQLVNNNKGTIRYTRRLDGGARFVLTF